MGPERRGGKAGQAADKPENPSVVLVEENDAEQLAKNAKELQKRKHRRVRALRSFLLRLISLALIVYILLFHVVGLTVMAGGDMSPRLSAGDLLLFYRIDRTAKARDVVVIDKAVNRDNSANTEGTAKDPGFIRRALNWLGFKDPDAPETKRFVCRVIACAGDTVVITDEGGLTVNGNALTETDIFSPTRPYEGYTEYPVTLGEGEYFVLSDLRNGGTDSRYFGIVTQDEIQGIVITMLRRNNL